MHDYNDDNDVAAEDDNAEDDDDDGDALDQIFNEGEAV